MLLWEYSSEICWKAHSGALRILDVNLVGRSVSTYEYSQQPLTFCIGWVRLMQTCLDLLLQPPHKSKTCFSANVHNSECWIHSLCMISLVHTNCDRENLDFLIDGYLQVSLWPPQIDPDTPIAVTHTKFLHSLFMSFMFIWGYLAINWWSIFSHISIYCSWENSLQ